MEVTGYISSGRRIVGSVSRTAGAGITDEIDGIRQSISNARIINVLNEGAKGNGITNDTLAIQSAVNAYPGYAIYFPKGTYLIDSLTIPQPCVIYGDGSKSIIRQSQQSTAGDFIDCQRGEMTIRDLSIEGNTTGEAVSEPYSSPTNGLSMGGFGVSTVENIRVRRFTGNGCVLRIGSLVMRIKNCIFSNNDGNGLSSLATDSIFSDVICYSNRLNGFFMQGTTPKMVNCYSYLNGCGYKPGADDPSPAYTSYSGYRIDAHKAVLTGCTSEENFGHGFLFFGKQGNVYNCLSSGNNVPYFDVLDSGTRDNLTDAWNIRRELNNTDIYDLLNLTKSVEYYDFYMYNGGIVKNCYCSRLLNSKYGNTYKTKYAVSTALNTPESCQFDILSSIVYDSIPNAILNSTYSDDSIIRVNNASLLSRILSVNEFVEGNAGSSVTFATSGGTYAMIRHTYNRIKCILGFTCTKANSDPATTATTGIPPRTATAIGRIKSPYRPKHREVGMIYGTGAQNSLNYPMPFQGRVDIDLSGQIIVTTTNGYTGFGYIIFDYEI